MSKGRGLAVVLKRASFNKLAHIAHTWSGDKGHTMSSFVTTSESKINNIRTGISRCEKCGLTVEISTNKSPYITGVPISRKCIDNNQLSFDFE